MENLTEVRMSLCKSILVALVYLCLLLLWPSESYTPFYLRRSTQVYKWHFLFFFFFRQRVKTATLRLLTLKLLKAELFGMNIYNFWDGQLFVYYQLYIYFSQIYLLEASDAKAGHSQDVENKNFKFFENFSFWFIFSCLFTSSNKSLRGLKCWVC